MIPAPEGLPPVLAQGATYTLPGFLAHPQFRLKDVASSVLSSLLREAGAEGDYRSQLAATDARLRECGAGALKEHTLHLYPRQALHAAKAIARAHGGFVSASTDRFERALLAAGWSAGAPGPVRQSLVIEGKRRTVWSVPAFVFTHAAAFTPTSPEPAEALRMLVDSLGLDFTSRLAGTGRSSVENWLYAEVPITVARRARLVTAATIMGLFTASGTLDPYFWLSQPSEALRRIPGIDPVPMNALETEEDHQLIITAALRSCAAPL